MNYKDLFINGEWVSPLSNKWIEVENPANKEIICRVPNAGLEDIEKAIEAGQKALPSWANRSPSQRQDKVEKMVSYLIDNFSEIRLVLASELGCSPSFALSRHLKSYKSAMEGFLDDHRQMVYEEEREGYRLYRRPKGLVACLTPWNYPFGQIVRKVIPALLAGNTVILKPSKSTPMTAYFWAQAALVAELPPGVFNLLPGRGAQVGNVLAQDPRIQAISFTGSTKGGKEIASLALSSSTKRITLEMGGKSAAIFLPGATNYSEDLKKVLDSVYLNTGQTCSAKTRLLVPKKDQAQIEEILIQLTKEYKFGNPLIDENAQTGVLNSQNQLHKVQSYIQVGLKEGARLLYGCLEERQSLGYEIGPYIFTDVKPHMAIAQEEIFGPVLCLLSYDSVEEAIDIANNSIYGLSGMVFGPKEDALYVASQIQSGQIQINGAPPVQNAPFGGFKESGIGREGGKEGWDEFYEYQTIFV